MSPLIIIALVSFSASLLTFFSGFGLGTLLMPVMALYFPLPVAIAATAVVHFANNIFKAFLLFKLINKKVFLQFAIPALIGTLLGVYLLMDVDPMVLYQVEWNNKMQSVNLTEFLIALIMLLICALDWIPDGKLKFGKHAVIPGGFLTGFFGGFTGMQGAIRSAFLSQINLSKEEFVATSSAISILIDSCRIIGYLVAGTLVFALHAPWPIAVGIVGALTGAILGKRLLKKTTIQVVKVITTACIVLFAVMLMLGLV